MNFSDEQEGIVSSDLALLYNPEYVSSNALDICRGKASLARSKNAFKRFHELVLLINILLLCLPLEHRMCEYFDEFIMLILAFETILLEFLL